MLMERIHNIGKISVVGYTGKSALVCNDVEDAKY